MSTPHFLTPRRAALLLAIAAATSCSAGAARAADPVPPASDARGVELAERRAAEAYDAYVRKDYAGAVALYLEAYEAAPSGIVLYNIARIYDTKLADRPLAMTFYRRYISDPGAETERIKLANQRLSELRAAEAASNEPARAPREPNARRAALPTEPAASHASTGESGGWSTLRWSGVAIGALGVIGVGVGSVYGLVAASKLSTAREACDGSRCSTQAGVDAARTASDKATLSTIGFTAGGALLVAGAALFIAGAEPATQERVSTRLGWDASLSRSALAFELKGHF